jgi:hypothetical protein
MSAMFGVCGRQVGFSYGGPKAHHAACCRTNPLAASSSRLIFTLRPSPSVRFASLTYSDPQERSHRAASTRLRPPTHRPPTPGVTSSYPNTLVPSGPALSWSVYWDMLHGSREVVKGTLHADSSRPAHLCSARACRSSWCSHPCGATRANNRRTRTPYCATNSDLTLSNTRSDACSVLSASRSLPMLTFLKASALRRQLSSRNRRY